MARKPPSAQVRYGARAPPGWTGLRRALDGLSGLAASRAFRSLLSAILLATAIWVIAREFRTISPAQVASALQATRPAAILASIGLAACSYACLTGTEWFSLHWLGQPLTPWQAAGAAVPAYAISNTVGFSAASGAAVRLRCYSPLGLSAGKIAMVSLIAGTAVTFSGVVAAGAAVALDALAFSRALSWPIPLVVGLAAALLAPAALWFMAFRPEGPSLLGGGTARSPTTRERLIALAVGLADWAFSGAALYALLPIPTLGAFPPFLAVFILGSLVSAASGVPGGLGVFEAVVIGLTKLMAETHETTAALLLYRLIYSIGPASVVMMVFAGRQALKTARSGKHGA